MEINIGININDDYQPFTDLILDGSKTIETRNTPTLRPYVGKRVGIISTSKKRKAKLVGYVDIVKEIEYTNEKQFNSDYNKHLVGKDSPFYIKDVKYGYVLSNSKRIESRDIYSKGIISRSLNKEPMEISKRQLQENLNNIIYTAVFFDTNEIVSKYPQVHPNLYSHHSTIQFKPTDISNLPIGEEINIKVIGRLTNDKVDALIVSNPLSKNKFPHITLSTAEGIKPFQSNVEIENNQDKIKPINDNLIGAVGYFDGKNEVTEKQTQFKDVEITKGELEEAKKARTKLRKKKKGDRCTRIAKSKYDVWPSAYASGAVVKCRQGKIWRGLKEEESLNEYETIIEPKRQNPKSTLDLGISTDEGKGVDNIIAVYNEANPEEKEFWGKWYYSASDNVKELASDYEIDFRIAAAVVAVLSPGNKWKDNLLAAEKVIKKFKNPSLNIPINAYGKNVIKALKILETGDVAYVKGPKVSVFFLSLVDPQSVLLVLDSHAINIWFGIKRSLKQTPNIPKTIRQRMLDDYKTAAEILGISLQSLQAVTWYIWKYTTNPPQVPHTNIEVETNELPLDEKWSEKYKRSIDCNNPKGFSQKAHCKGRLKEEIDASEAYEVDSAIQTVIDKKRNVGLVDLDSQDVEELKQKGINVIPVFPEGSDIRNQYTKEMSGWGESGAKYFADRSFIIYNNEGKQDAKKLYDYMKSHNGFVSDTSPQEAMYIGKLLGYSDNSIEDYINRKYNMDEKTDFSKEKEQGLHGWFARQGGKGKSKGWVDCNTCRNGKCKSCGRKEGESRSKYPACRPTPSACKTKGRGDSWGKKSTNEDILNEQSKQDIENELKLNEIKNTFKRLLK